MIFVIIIEAHKQTFAQISFAAAAAAMIDFLYLKDCERAGSGGGASGKPTAATWPWFVLMHEASGQRHFTTPTALIASIPEDTTGPSTAVDDQQEEGRGGGG